MYFNLKAPKPIAEHAKLFAALSLVLAALLLGILVKYANLGGSEISSRELMTNETLGNGNKTRRKEYLYRLLTNTTRSLIQMEIKARRVEENMRRIREKTADLLWRNKDKALWRVLFKNISRHNAIRHKIHGHASLTRILREGSQHKDRRKWFTD